MKKRFLSLLLALAMVVSFASAASAETVKFWSHQNEAWNNSYYELIAEFEAANPDITIEYTQFPYTDFQAKIQTSLLAGEASGDVYEVWGGWMFDLVSTGALSETPAELTADLQNDAYAPVLGALTHDGKFYGAPVEFNLEYGGMLLNKKLHEQFGLDYPTTWAQVIENAKKVAVTEGETMTMRGFDYLGPDTATFNYLAMILQNGGQYLKEDGSVDFTTPEAVNAMKTMLSYTTEDHINNIEAMTSPGSNMGFMMVGMDQCLGCVNGPWVISTLNQYFGLVNGVDFDYVSQPPFVEGAEPKFASETGWTLCVPKNSQVSDAAWKFVEFLTSPEVLKRHNIACAQVPPRKSVANDPEFIASAPYVEPLLDKLEYAQFIGPFNSDVLKSYISQTVMALVTGDHSDEAIAAACEKLTSDLADVLTIY